MRTLAAAVLVPLALTPQNLVDDSTTWLRSLGIPAEQRVAHVSHEQPVENFTALAFIRKGDPTVHTSPWLYSRWTELGQGKSRPMALKALLHEQLHLPGPGRLGPTEEGIVESVAWDLAPAYGRRIGVRTRIHKDQVAYAEHVHNIRWLSAKVCPNGWPSRCGRLFRRALLVADDAQRDQMIASATVSPSSSAMTTKGDTP